MPRASAPSTAATSPARVLGRGNRLPKILVRPPGPRSRAFARRASVHEAPGINAWYRGTPPLFWQGARGANVVDVDGNRFIDLTAGFGAAAVGHANPRVIQAVAEQSSRLLHGLGDVHSHTPRVELAQRLCRIAPVDHAQVYFTVTGSEAVEVALKTAMLASGKAGVLAFDGAYHGLTFGALAATSRAAFREPFLGHLTPHLTRLPYGASLLKLAPALRSGIGCVLVEPILGREGIVSPPEGWLADLAALCRSSGVLLIADEIFTGFGRSGRLFAVDRDHVRPDLLCCGKALGGGMPIGAVIGRRELMSAWRTEGEALHTSTFVAHPVACAAAIAVLDLLREQQLARRAMRLGRSVKSILRSCSQRPDLLVRGHGLLWAIELEGPERAARVVRGALERGVILLAGGPRGCVLQIAPPLVITPTQLETALGILIDLLDCA
ncbi:MAG: aspartate aminotransferase family protein [Acidobacteriota bacterium]